MAKSTIRRRTRAGGPSAHALFLSAVCVAGLAVASATSGCSCGDNGNASGGAFPTGSGTTAPGAGGGGGTTFTTGPGSTGSGGNQQCKPACKPTEVCSHATCVPLTTCKTNDDCENDTYCASDGTCQPWDSKNPPYDPNCINAISPGVFAPKVRCEFSTPPNGDPFPQHVDVQSTPIVVNFHKPSSDGPPSILASFTATVVNNYTEDLGVIRVLNGKDCTLEANIGGGQVVPDYTVSSATLAVGDLDGDGIADIVAYAADGGTMAFTKKSGTWAQLWKAPYPAGAPWAPCDTAGHRCSLGWAGPSIHDLDDDGVPEVIREGVVFDGKTGAVKSMQPPNYQSYAQGNFPVLANLDQDPAIELTNGRFIWKWTGGAWVQMPGFDTGAPGFVAVADFGAFGTGPSKNPEIVVVRNNTVAIYAIDGTVVMPPTAVPGMGGGGPPTIADFDGDGLPEVAVAGKGFYTIYDIDCGPNPRPGGTCGMGGTGTCDFVPGACAANSYYAWSRTSQDYSSDVTGSSVFDFEADGTSEVIYADECFVRVYNGKTGEVEFSQYHSSCTWYENPVVADTDGNFRADLVTPSNKACSPSGDGIACSNLDANGVDALFAGLHCKKNGDCVSGVCDSGLCRCTAGAECCGDMDDAKCLEQGYACVPPPAGTPGTGNTCRAAHPHGLSGIRVYSDANDKWVRSRAIWNQHAYAVTNVNEDGTIPKTSNWKNNWDDPTLNNFRQNVPGDANGKATGDATAGASGTFGCNGSEAKLHAPVCNRGADPIAAGLSVGFYVGGSLVCEAMTTMTLQPGSCEDIACTWSDPPHTPGTAVDVTVEPNDQHQYAECNKDNNDGTILAVFCVPPH